MSPADQSQAGTPVLSDNRRGRGIGELARWVVWYVLLWGVLYGAFVAQVAGALHVLKFYVWAVALVSPMALADRVVAGSLEIQSRPLLGLLSRAQELATLALLVWFGHFASAAAWALALALFDAHRKMVREARAGSA